MRCRGACAARPLTVDPAHSAAAAPGPPPGARLVEVVFQPGNHFVLVRPGVTLLAASRLAGVDIATGCTRGMCGTDAVRILPGGPGDQLDPPEAHERGTLERMGIGAEFRLACSAVVRAGTVRVELGAF